MKSFSPDGDHSLITPDMRLTEQEMNELLKVDQWNVYQAACYLAGNEYVSCPSLLDGFTEPNKIYEFFIVTTKTAILSNYLKLTLPTRPLKGRIS